MNIFTCEIKVALMTNHMKSIRVKKKLRYLLSLTKFFISDRILVEFMWLYAEDGTELQRYWFIKMDIFSITDMSQGEINK